MDIVKIPRMEKQDYDRLIDEGYVCRIAFQGENARISPPSCMSLTASSSISSRQNMGKRSNISRAPT